MFETLQQAYQRILALAKQKCRVCGQRKELVTVCGLCGEKLDPMCKSCWQTYHSPVCLTSPEVEEFHDDDPDDRQPSDRMQWMQALADGYRRQGLSPEAAADRAWRDMNESAEGVTGL